MAILSEDIDRVRQASDLVAIASEHVQLKRQGRRWLGLCPFHQEKTPSFGVNAELGYYKCFGCDAGGDVFDFVQQIEGLDFVESVERLAKRAGIELRYDQANVTRERRQRDRLIEVNAAAVDFYHDLLLHHPGAGLARRYLRQRGFDGDAARRFQLGWAPDAWDQCAHFLQQQKFSRDDVLKAGLAMVNRANRLQDHFRARLLFPIFDTRGDPVGFGGRTLTDQGPKYINTAETPLYHKQRLLYGLNWARTEVVNRGEVILCEGYTDVMAFTLAGVPNAIATCGTALTDDHIGALKNFARSMVLAYDADAAGQAAAERLYQWESKFELRLKVAAMPAGSDPADLYLADPASLPTTITAAKPFLQFQIERVLGRADLVSVEGRADAARLAVARIAEHPSDLVRDQYLMQLQGVVQIDIDRLRQAVERARKGRPEGDGSARGSGPPVRSPARPAEPALVPPRPRQRPFDRRETEALRLAVHHPELVAHLLEDVLFTDTRTHAVFVALAHASAFHEALAQLDDECRNLLEQLAVDDPALGPDVELQANQTVGNLAVARATRLLDELLESDEERATDLKQRIDAYHNAYSVEDWATAFRVAEGLVVLLTHWSPTAPGEAGSS